MSAYSLLFPYSSPSPHCEAPCLQPGICFKLFSMPRNTHACKQLEWRYKSSGGLQDALMALVQYLHCFEEHSDVYSALMQRQQFELSSQAARSGRFFSWRAESIGKRIPCCCCRAKLLQEAVYVCICCALVACRALRTWLWQCWRMWPTQTCAVTVTSGWHPRVLLKLVRC